MPTSSSAATAERRRSFRVQTQVNSIERHDGGTFLTIESALPPNDRRKLYKRSHSTLQNPNQQSDPITIHSSPDGSLRIARNQNERDGNPDRISLDRRGVTTFPIIDGESKLRLLSLQHNLITNLDGLVTQNFPHLVFLDIYDNQLERMGCLGCLNNLRVLLMGKNRIRKIEGLDLLSKIEVLDLHGNQITQVNGLGSLSQLKVLNLAGNQIRYIGTMDFHGLGTLQELNLRRNRLKKLLGFAETPSLAKIFLSNNDLQCVENISSLAKSTGLKEIAIDNNPVFLGGDCVSFLVSYLPQLTKLNTIQITDQVRKAAMAWRRNKESTNSAFMDLTSDVCLNVRREEVISNARTNWELLRSQTKCLTKSTTIKPTLNLKVDSDLILTSLGRARRVPRSNSQETDTSSNTSSEYIRLPPILVPILHKMEQRDGMGSKEGSDKLSGSLSSVGPNVDSSVSSLASDNESSNSESEEESEEDVEQTMEEKLEESLDGKGQGRNEGESKTVETESSISNSTNSDVVNISNPPSKPERNPPRTIKSAVNSRSVQPKVQGRAVTAKPFKKQNSSEHLTVKEREQGGDYLIEICGRYLNVYGQCALRFIDRPWNPSKANDVTSAKFNYVNFNGITGILNKLKLRFPNVDHFYFKETNIHSLGQLNALAEVQGLASLYIDPEGNPIVGKNWRSYAIYRLSHWGLSTINDVHVDEDEIKRADAEFQSLSDLVLWSLPDVLLQPLLVRLRLDVSCAEQSAKKWLLAADPDLRSVVSKEALQWKKAAVGIQEESAIKQKAKSYMSRLLDEMGNSVNKLRLLDRKWPTIFHELVRNALLDYSQLDRYMKEKMSELK